MKLCRECHWYKLNPSGGSGICQHRLAASTTGEWQHDCADMRYGRGTMRTDTDGPCGRDAKLWEPQRSFWRWLRAAFSQGARHGEG